MDPAGSLTPLCTGVVRQSPEVAARSASVWISLRERRCKEVLMDAAAKVSSKGQVTVPKAVRDALGITEGDEVVFRVEGNRAVLARTPDFLELAGTIRVPAAKRNVAWDEVIRRTRSARAASRR